MSTAGKSVWVMSYGHVGREVEAARANKLEMSRTLGIEPVTKTIYYVSTSVDGFIAGANDSLDSVPSVVLRRLWQSHLRGQTGL